ncbi:MAG: 3'-5' exonuclease [Hyphomicrobiaceae bacterium]
MNADQQSPGIDPATALEASGDYRVLRKLGKRSQFGVPDGTPTKIGVVLDIETTGLSPTSDEIIEFGMVKFTFSGDGRVFDVVDEFTALREPSIPLPAAITELTGISTEMVTGQRIDADQVGRFIDDAVLVIAHGAAFDRPFCEVLFPAFADKHWACSNTEVDWRARRHRGSKLTYLLNDIGLFYEGHRALDDCRALLEVLAATTPHAAGTALGALLQTARKATVRIWAQAAPFEHKDTLKVRGYRWSDGSGDAPKAWWRDVEEVSAEAELAFLRADIYQNDAVDLPTKRFTSLQRFSARI